MAETTYYVDTDVSGGAGDGSSWANAYSSLNQAEQARDADIRSENAVVFRCRASGGTADVAAVNINGWTTDSDSYVKVYCDSADTGGRHAGVWSTSKYRISTTDATPLSLTEDYIRVDGLQLEAVSPTANSRHGIYISGVNAANLIYVSNCLIRGHGHGTYTQDGINCGDNDLIAHAWNCIIYGIAKLASCRPIITTGTVGVYGCTLAGGQYGLRTAGTTVVKNTYAGDALTECFYYGSGTLDKTNCASSDGSADDTGANETQSNCVNDILYDTTEGAGHAGFTNVTAGSENFTLKAGSDLVGRGATLTDDPPGSTALGVDIIGTTRS